MPTVERTGAASAGTALEPYSTAGGGPAPSVLASMYRALRDLAAVVAGRLSLGTPQHGRHTGHLDGQWHRVVTPSLANTAFAVPHGLGRIPSGYWIVRSSAAVQVFDDPQNAHTSEVLWLQATAASATIWLIVVAPPA